MKKIWRYNIEVICEEIIRKVEYGRKIFDGIMTKNF